MSPIERFIQTIEKATLPGVFNPWRDRCEHDLYPNAAEKRRQRLVQHLSAPHVGIIGIGEAPGYQGCRYSGCAFTSEKLLINGAIPRIASLQGQRLTDRPLPFSEPSATIVWTLLYDLGIAESTVLWNAFPFHPYNDKPWSNRTPTDSELSWAEPVLKQFLALFPDAVVVAIGKKAAGSLAKLGVSGFHEVRHPSNGGKPEFEAGLKKVLRTTSL